MGESKFSKFSDRLEDYQCFYNPATGYVTGAELLKIKKEANEKAKKKWLYFFTVDEEAVGAPQKLEIFFREVVISLIEDSLKEKQTYFLIRAIPTAIVMIILLLFIFAPLTLIPLGYLGFLGVKFFFPKLKLDKKIGEMQNEITKLKDEIEQLLNQVERFNDAGEIEAMLKKEVKRLEFKSISEVVHSEIDRDDLLDSLIESDHTDRYYGVRSLLIDGWGMMQPYHIQNSRGEFEKTGLNRVINDLGINSLAVGLDTESNPLFRVYYFQFIFLLENNLNVVSFFYDFIHREKYGRKQESFQYPHVTSFAIRESEMDESQVNALGELMRPMFSDPNIPNIFLKQDFQSFSLSMADGSRFKCVLVDEVVRNALNEWFKAIDAAKEFLKLDPNDPKLKEKFTFNGVFNKEKMEEYIKQKKIEMEEKRKLYQTIKQNYENVSKAREALKEVSSGVERYAKPASQ